MIALLEVFGFTLLDPWFLLGIPLVALLLLARLWRRRAALPAATTSLFTGLPRSLRARAVHLPLCGKALAGCVLSVALARPVVREVMPLQELGVDILLVADISSSMTIPDMDERQKLRRVDAVRARALAFARARGHDRIGLLTFSRYPELRCPLTLDQQALAAFLRAIEAVRPNSEIDGTAIGAALGKAVQVLGRSQAKSRVVVLLTDGEETVDTIPARDGAKLAADAGIRVHTIGLGNGTPMPGGGWYPTDFGALQQIAQQTGGRFFAAKSNADLAEVYAAIDQMEKVPLQDPRYRMVDHFELPLGAGLSLLLLALLLEFLWIRGVP